MVNLTVTTNTADFNIWEVSHSYGNHHSSNIRWSDSNWQITVVADPPNCTVWHCNRSTTSTV